MGGAVDKVNVGQLELRSAGSEYNRTGGMLLKLLLKARELSLVKNLGENSL